MCCIRSNLHPFRNISPKRVTSGGVHMRDLTPGQHCFKETLLWWRHRVRFDLPGNRTHDLPLTAMSLTTIPRVGSDVQYVRCCVVSYKSKYCIIRVQRKQPFDCYFDTGVFVSLIVKDIVCIVSLL